MAVADLGLGLDKPRLQLDKGPRTSLVPWESFIESSHNRRLRDKGGGRQMSL